MVSVTTVKVGDEAVLEAALVEIPIIVLVVKLELIFDKGEGHCSPCLAAFLGSQSLSFARAAAQK